MENIQLKIEIDQDPIPTLNEIKNETAEYENSNEEPSIIKQGADSNSNSKNQPNDEDNQFKCPSNGCTKTLKSKKLLWHHKQVHLNKLPYKCQNDSCGRSFRTEYQLSMHMFVHSEVKEYKCTYEGCSRQFKYKGDMQKHSRLHSSTKLFECTYKGCCKSFKSLSEFNGHKRSHSNIRPYQCKKDGCLKAFKTKDALRGHFFTHTDDRPFKCSVGACKRRFKQKKDLKDHSLSHSTVGGRFQCKIKSCSKRFTSGWGFRQHLRRHQAVVDVCNIEKKTRETLVEHEENRGQSISVECSKENEGSSQTCLVDVFVKSEPIDASFDDVNNAPTNCEEIEEVYIENNDGIKLEGQALPFRHVPMLEQKPVLVDNTTNANVPQTAEEETQTTPTKKNPQPKKDIDYEQKLLDILTNKLFDSEYDEDICFSKMIVSMMRKLDDEQKHFAKIEILDVLQKAKGNFSVAAQTRRTYSQCPESSNRMYSQSSSQTEKQLDT